MSRLSTKQRRARRRWAPIPGYRIVARYYDPENGRVRRVIVPESWFTPEGWRAVCEKWKAQA